MSSSPSRGAGAHRARLLDAPQLAAFGGDGWALEELAVPAPPVLALHDDLAEAGDPDDTPTPAEAAAHAAAQAARLAHEAAERERLEREAIAADAFARGFEEGRLTGEVAEGQRLRTAVQAAERALEEFHESEMRWHGAIEENLSALAVAVARHVIGREVQLDPALVSDLVRRALTEFPLDQALTIRVNPRDLATITGLSVAGGEGPVSANREARWVADAQVAPGGCIVEGRDRIVDGRVDTALERVWRRLTYSHS